MTAPFQRTICPVGMHKYIDVVFLCLEKSPFCRVKSVKTKRKGSKLLLQKNEK